MEDLAELHTLRHSPSGQFHIRLRWKQVLDTGRVEWTHRRRTVEEHKRIKKSVTPTGLNSFLFHHPHSKGPLIYPSILFFPKLLKVGASSIFFIPFFANKVEAEPRDPTKVQSWFQQ